MAVSVATAAGGLGLLAPLSPRLSDGWISNFRHLHDENIDLLKPLSKQKRGVFVVPFLFAVLLNFYTGRRQKYLLF